MFVGCAVSSLADDGRGCGRTRRLCVCVCVWEGLISSLRHNIICAIFVTGPWVYLHIVLLLLCCCLFFHSAFVAADAKGGGDVSDLLYRRRCCVYINRSFCSQQEQKDDTISWVFMWILYGLSFEFFLLFFFCVCFLFFFFFFCAFWWQIALFASVQMEMNQHRRCGRWDGGPWAVSRLIKYA